MAPNIDRLLSFGVEHKFMTRLALLLALLSGASLVRRVNKTSISSNETARDNEADQVINYTHDYTLNIARQT